MVNTDILSLQGKDPPPVLCGNSIVQDSFDKKGRHRLQVPAALQFGTFLSYLKSTSNPYFMGVEKLEARVDFIEPPLDCESSNVTQVMR
eukprot:CAMPEP_0194375402 /NCGR_PEP_ID=MMETSP0174-20130528/23910_1 /TAXON_ID=216777 /ORGANISM="Proboscia alata, Strain PI-D3" /LENGTH=88 /DNA_ID=CAMNT_0039155571 /DNA_START=179 /DNA_END=445 /DNA_ORIENTATION=-